MNLEYLNERRVRRTRTENVFLYHTFRISMDILFPHALGRTRDRFEGTDGRMLAGCGCTSADNRLRAPSQSLFQWRPKNND